MTGQLEVFENSLFLVHEASMRVSSWLIQEVTERGTCTFVLSGGNTPRDLYQYLGSSEAGERIPWSKVHVLWGDERCVGPTLPSSNFRMASDALLKSIPIPERNIHRIQGELAPQEAARAYEADIRRLSSLREGEIPSFTVVLLGLGEDGHTASLFPGTSVLLEKKRLVTEVFVDALKTSRITMTLPVLNNARHVLFLVTGRNKAAVLQQVLEDETPRYPAQMINPRSGSLVWFADRDAASLLQR
jgi:6-phosphogluconolactonase